MQCLVVYNTYLESSLITKVFANFTSAFPNCSSMDALRIEKGIEANEIKAESYREQSIFFIEL